LQPALWGALATRCAKGLIWASAQDTLGSTKKKSCTGLRQDDKDD